MIFKSEMYGKENIFARAMQALSVACWVYISLFGGLTTIGLAVYMLLFTKYWYIPLIYLAWLYVDRNTPRRGGRKCKAVRNMPIWKYFKDYFPMRLVKTTDLSTERNYILVSHPHGIIALSAIAQMTNNYSDFNQHFGDFNSHLATLNVNFMWPVVRDYYLALGGVSASRDSLEHILDPRKKGNLVMLVVGGSAEALVSRPNYYHLVIRRRLGFIRLALNTGCSLVPVFSFGEVDLFDQVSNPKGSILYRLQEWFLRATGVGFCLPIGRGFFQESFGLLPRRKPVTTVVGEPIDMPRIANPTQDQLAHYHQLYITKLEKLFYDNLRKYISDSKNVKLIIE